MCRKENYGAIGDLKKSWSGFEAERGVEYGKIGRAIRVVEIHQKKEALLLLRFKEDTSA